MRRPSTSRADSGRPLTLRVLRYSEAVKPVANYQQVDLTLDAVCVDDARLDQVIDRLGRPRS
jgi:hypothetical protein